MVKVTRHRPVPVRLKELWDNHEADLPFTQNSRFPGDWRLIYSAATVLSARDRSVTEYGV